MSPRTCEDLKDEQRHCLRGARSFKTLNAVHLHKTRHGCRQSRRKGVWPAQRPRVHSERRVSWRSISMAGTPVLTSHVVLQETLSHHYLAYLPRSRPRFMDSFWVVGPCTVFLSFAKMIEAPRLPTTVNFTPSIAVTVSDSP